MRIDNKRIIVVGASRGLGRGIAAALAAAGARVLAIARDGAEMVRMQYSPELNGTFTPSNEPSGSVEYPNNSIGG